MRYNPPELLEDYLDSKRHRLEEKRALRPQSSRRAGEDSRRTSLSEVSEESEAESESAEDVIFALFGPRVWDHEGEWEVGGCPVTQFCGYSCRYDLFFDF